jgi:hypothetical protein
MTSNAQDSFRNPSETLSRVEGHSEFRNFVPGPEAQWLIDNFGDCIKGLIHYGSRAFGHPRKGSAYDVWLIVDDLRKKGEHVISAPQDELSGWRRFARRNIDLGRFGPARPQ